MAHFSRSQFLLGFGLALLLVGCAAAVDVQVQCLPMVQYTAAQQTALALEIRKLPADSLLLRALLDYEALRDADRACQTAAAAAVAK